MPVVVQAEGKHICGTYVHGIFDHGQSAYNLISTLADQKGILLSPQGYINYEEFKESQYEKLADTLREYLDMEAIYGMLKEAKME